MFIVSINNKYCNTDKLTNKESMLSLYDAKNTIFYYLAVMELDQTCVVPAANVHRNFLIELEKSCRSIKMFFINLKSSPIKCGPGEASHPM